MFKPVIAATAVLALAGSSIVYAQQRFGDHHGFGDRGPRAEQRHHWSAQDIAAFADARIAALKAGLEMTPDQAKNWPSFEQALRGLVQLRIQRLQAREARQGETPQTPASPFERLAGRADSMAKTSAALKSVADAGAPLYQSLTDDQKSRFTVLARLLRPHHRIQRGWRQGYGYGRDGEHGGHSFGRDGYRFGQDGRGPGGPDWPAGRMHRSMTGDADQGSQL